MEKELNIVKRTAKELGMTYRQLGEAIGLSEAHIKRLAQSDDIGEQVKKSLQMLMRIDELEKETQDYKDFKIQLKKLTE